MMYPILCKVQYEILHRIFSHRGAWKQIGFSVFVNWIMAPLFMVWTSPVLVAASSIFLYLPVNSHTFSWRLPGRSYPTKVNSAWA